MKITLSIEKLIMHHLITQRASCSSEGFQRVICVSGEKLCLIRNFIWSFLLLLLFNKITYFIHSSWIANFFRTCRMPGLRQGILFHVLLSHYPLLTLDSALKSFLVTKGENFFFLQADFYKRLHFIFGSLTFLRKFILPHHLRLMAHILNQLR